MTDTLLRLQRWDHGAYRSELLVAHALHCDGYRFSDLHNPRGGPDGKKDITCRFDSVDCLCAVYFPFDQNSFSKTEKKFIEDFQGATANSIFDKFLFCTNQRLTTQQKDSLKSIAGKNSMSCEIYDADRLCLILDSPRGYYIRGQYLQLPVSTDELSSVLAGLADFKRSIDDRMIYLTDKIEQVHAHTVAISEQMPRPDLVTRDLGSEFLIADHTSGAQDGDRCISERLSIDLVGFVNLAVCEGSDRECYGLRTTRVEIRRVDPSGREIAEFEGPPSELVLDLLNQLLDTSRERFSALVDSEIDEKVSFVCWFFHSFLLLHPFADGNGRTARCIAKQMIFDLFGERIRHIFGSSRDAYYRALMTADLGDFHPLRELLRAQLPRQD